MFNVFRFAVKLRLSLSNKNSSSYNLNLNKTLMGPYPKKLIGNLEKFF